MLSSGALHGCGSHGPGCRQACRFLHLENSTSSFSPKRFRGFVPRGIGAHFFERNLSLTGALVFPLLILLLASAAIAQTSGRSEPPVTYLSRCISRAERNSARSYINSTSGQLTVSERSGGNWSSIVLGSGYNASSSVAVTNFGNDVHLVALNAGTGSLSEFKKVSGAWSSGVLINANARGSVSIAVRGSELLVSFSDRTSKDLILARKVTTWDTTNGRSHRGRCRRRIGASQFRAPGRLQSHTRMNDAHRKGGACPRWCSFRGYTSFICRSIVRRSPAARWTADERLHLLSVIRSRM